MGASAQESAEDELTWLVMVVKMLWHRTSTDCIDQNATQKRTVVMKQLPIVWQRLVSREGTTCPRCSNTHQEVQKAMDKLKEVLSPLNIEPVLEIKEIDENIFKTTPSESNRIWIGGRPMEAWLGANVGSSRCCSVCGDSACRTVEIAGATFETIPEDLLIKAALMASSHLLEVRSATPHE